MRSLAFIAALLFAVPALAADAKPAAPPSPPPVTYNVWGFQWNGQQYVKQADHSFSTTDIKQAADYATQINSYAGWSATTNLPEAFFVHTVFHGPAITNVRPSAFPDAPTYSVWAFKLTDGKWVKDESYSWTSADPQLALDYATKVNAVPGWMATTNCPTPVPQAQRYVDGGTVHGAKSYYRQARAPGFNVSADGQTIYLPRFNIAIRVPAGTNWNVNSGDTESSDSSFYDNSSSSSDTSVQDSIATQDMINNQQMQNNIQDMLNTQNFNETENEINNEQNALNAQPLVNP